MANNILKYKGYEIGKSILEKNCSELIKEIFYLFKKKNVKFFSRRCSCWKKLG